MKRIRRHRFHFVGIGGAGMAPLALAVQSLGYKVTGSDVFLSESVRDLERRGIPVVIGHRRSNIRGATDIVYSTAIRKSNPEIKAASKEKISLFHRSELLSNLIKEFESIAVVGTHGKTTTTALLGSALERAGAFPTTIVGGRLKSRRRTRPERRALKDTSDRIPVSGKGQLYVFEADESDGSFLNFKPDACIITNIDEDHMEFFRTRKRLLDYFTKFLGSIPFDGLIAANADDPSVRKLTDRLGRPLVYFSTGLRMKKRKGTVCYYARNIIDEPKTSFLVYQEKKKLGKIITTLRGRHNISNILGVVALLHALGYSMRKILPAFESFPGVERRLDCLGKTAEGALVYDDYAHHPRAIASTLFALRKIKKKSIVFEPHRYSRLSYHWDAFVTLFSKLRHPLYLLPVYKASETSIPGVHIRGFRAALREKGKNSKILTHTMRDARRLSNAHGAGGAVIFFGAGRSRGFAENLVRGER